MSYDQKGHKTTNQIFFFNKFTSVFEREISVYDSMSLKIMLPTPEKHFSLFYSTNVYTLKLSNIIELMLLI